MERRYARIESGAASEDDFELLILVLDEYRDFYAIVAEWYAGIKVTGMPTRCPVLEKLGSLVRKGRSARVHVILGLQRPDADVLGGEMRDNFGTRISLGPLSPQGAMMMWESPHLGVALPGGSPGGPPPFRMTPGRWRSRPTGRRTRAGPPPPATRPTWRCSSGSSRRPPATRGCGCASTRSC